MRGPRGDDCLPGSSKISTGKSWKWGSAMKGTLAVVVVIVMLLLATLHSYRQLAWLQPGLRHVTTSCVTASRVKTTALPRKFASATSGNLFKGHVTRQYPPDRLAFSKTSGGAPGSAGFTTAFPSGCTSTKWGVVTTIFEPTKSMEKAAALSGWCLVIVGDKKTPHKLYEEMAAEN